MARTKKPAPAATNSSRLTMTGGAYSNNWISASGEAHGNGSFSASGGSFKGVWRNPWLVRRLVQHVR